MKGSILRPASLSLLLITLLSCSEDRGEVSFVEVEASDGSNVVSVYELTQTISNATWSVNGMAVDLQERVYIADGDTLWEADGEAISIYLGADQGDFGLFDVDIDEAGLLYMLNSKLEDQILTSNATGEFSTRHTLTGLTAPRYMGIVDSTTVAVVSREGLTSVFTDGAALAHADTALGGQTDCASEDFAIQRTGAFSYQPGCTGNSMIFGDLATGVPRTVTLSSATLDYNGALCTTRDPTGGFFSIVEFEIGGNTQLVHLDEDATDTEGWEVLGTTPAIDDATTDTLGFHGCQIAVGPSRIIYLAIANELWTFTPE